MTLCEFPATYSRDQYFRQKAGSDKFEGILIEDLAAEVAKVRDLQFQQPVLNTGVIPVDDKLLIGSQPSGETGLGTSTGTENTVDMTVQGFRALRISNNGELGAWGHTTIAGVVIDNDAVWQLQKNDINRFDQSNICLLGTNGISTAGLFQFRLNAGSEGEIEPMCQTLANMEFRKSNTAPTGTTGTAGKLTAWVNKTTDSIYLENRRGGPIAFFMALFGAGLGMTT